MANPSINASSNATHLPAPVVLWAQRNDVLLLTVNLDCRDPTVTFKDDSLYFRGKGGADEREVLMEFNKEIDPEKSKYNATGREVTFKIFKKEESCGFWDRLLKDSKKPHWLKTDFNRWKDEDDSDADADVGEDFNLDDMMQSMGGIQGGNSPMPEDNEDSDDEELPDLEGS